MEVRVYNPNQFCELKEIWNHLEKGEEMSIFQSYKWYKWLNFNALKEKTKNVFRDWKYLVALEDGCAIMIAPIQIIKVGKSIKGIGLNKGAYFFGRYGLTDYLNFIYDDFNDEAAESILCYLKDCLKIKYIKFEKIPENSGLSNYLKQNYDYNVQNKIQSAALTLPNSFEEYNASLKKNARQNIRTALNRQKRDEKKLYHEMVFDTNEDLNEILLGIRAQRLKEKQNKAVTKITSKAYNYVHKNFICKFNANVTIFDCYNDKWCFLIKDEDRIVGFFYGICEKEKKKYYAIIAGVDKEYAWYSPSISHFYKFIEEIYTTNNDSYEVFDFTRGDERYKTDIGGQIRFLENIELRF